MKKTITIVSLVLIVFIGIGAFLFKRNNSIKNVNNINVADETINETIQEIEETTFKLYKPTLYANSDEEVILTLLLNDKREEWDRINLSDKFKNKYKKQMVNMDTEISNYFWSARAKDELSIGLPERDEDIKCIYGDNNNGTYACFYKLISNEDYQVEDVEFKEKILIENKDGEKPEEVLLKFSNDNYLELFEIVLFPSVYDMNRDIDGHNKKSRKNIALTNGFIEKYGYDVDIIKYDTPLNMNSFSIKEDESDFNNRKLSFGITLPYENKHIDYVCKFVLNDNNYLNEINIVESKEKEINNEKFKYDWDIIKSVVIKNADWSLCPLSSKFLNKYNSDKSIIIDYDVIKLESLPKNKKLKKSKLKYVNDKYLYQIITKDKNLLCIFKVIKNANNEVDDILTYIVPEDKMNLTYEEMYQLAFND